MTPGRLLDLHVKQCMAYTHTAHIVNVSHTVSAYKLEAISILLLGVLLLFNIILIAEGASM